MYSFPSLEPVCCSIFGSNYCFLTSIQVSQEAGKVVWCSHLFKNFPQFVVIHTVKAFSVVNKAEVDVFLKFFCFLYDPSDVGHLITSSSAFSKSSLNIWKFLVHLLLKPTLENFEHYFASMWNECNCAIVCWEGNGTLLQYSYLENPSDSGAWWAAVCGVAQSWTRLKQLSSSSSTVVWAFFGIAFLWDWDENWPFPVLWPLLSFPNLPACWVQHFHSIIFEDLKKLSWNSITSTSFVHSDAS